MKRKTVISAATCFVLFFSSISIQSQKLQVFVHKNHYGILKDGKEIVKAKYEYISPLIDNDYFIVGEKGLFGVVDTNGKELIPPTYEALKYFSDGNFQATKNKKSGLINYRNYISLPLKYTDFKFISQDLAEIWDGNKVGYISKYGTIIIPPVYDSIQQFGSTVYLVSKNGKVGLIDSLQKKELLPIDYDSITLSSDPKYYDIKKNNQFGKMDMAYQVVIKPEYDSIESSDLGFLLRKNGKIGFYTTNGTLIKPDYTKIVFTQPEFGLVVVKEGNLLGFITSDGLVVSPRYDNLSRFSDRGIAFVERGGKLMAVNIEGKEITVQEVMGDYQAPVPTQGGYPF